MDEIKLRSSTFATVKINVDQYGVTELSIQNYDSSASVFLTADELGILLTSFGNSIAQGRSMERRRREQADLIREKKRGGMYD